MSGTQAPGVGRPALVLTGLLLGTVALSAGSGWTVRRDLEGLVGRQGGDLDGWAVFLSCLADPYSTIFVLLPVAAGLAAEHVTRRGDHAELIRHGSRARWLASTTRSSLGRIGALVFAWTLAALMPTAGLPWFAAFQPTAGQMPGSGYLLPHLATSGLSPQALAGAGVILLSTALLTGQVLLATLVALVGEHRQQGALVVAGAMAGPVAILVNFKLAVLPEWLDPACLLLLTPAAHLPGGPWSAVAIWILLAVCCWALLRWQHVLLDTAAALSRVADRLPRVPSGWLTYAAAVVLGLLGLRTVAASWQPATPTLWDCSVTALYTASPEGAGPLLWAFSSIATLGYGYLVLTHLDRAFGPQSLHALLRHGTPRRWVARQVTGPLLGAAALPVVLLAATTTLQAVQMAAAGQPLRLTTADGAASELLPGVTPGALAYQLLVNGALQQLVVVLAVVLVCLLTAASGSALSSDTSRTSLWPLAVLAAFLVASSPGIADHAVLPAGLGGAGHAIGGWPAAMGHTALLGGSAAGLTVAVVVAVRSLRPRHLCSPDRATATALHPAPVRSSL
ncbi:hypothetical protein SAMN06264364_10873 [Quadrisphaera granulorum]|uniref:ABC-2 type transport system permease protein n=1 Tax=Quadrisphaera granulorum TaxID=317664 RepID=A0A316A8C2_9ACTN|nr:hypothetical protein [Quadrisphaera granulorum]PWJ54166.1 hypothetical protein BXY45_10873 [Quadrisphaera granulorum]SZE96305.1 hypothetical protein SAMN06264364_10873 [Quadrisphaera granulorum]